MKTLALFSQKGGSGKTTLALHLAVAAHQAGKRVQVIDVDPQASAAAWAQARQAATGLDWPQVRAVRAADLLPAIERARASGCELLILDTPPHSNFSASGIAKAADFLLLPVRPSPVDLATVPATLAIVRAAGTPAAFVLSACPIRAPEVQEMAEILKGHGLPVLGPVHDRRSLFRAFTAGLAVTEFEPSGSAAHEIESLYKSTKDLMQ